MDSSLHPQKLESNPNSLPTHPPTHSIKKTRKKERKEPTSVLFCSESTKGDENETGVSLCQRLASPPVSQYPLPHHPRQLRTTNLFQTCTLGSEFGFEEAEPMVKGGELCDVLFWKGVVGERARFWKFRGLRLCGSLSDLRTEIGSAIDYVSRTESHGTANHGICMKNPLICFLTSFFLVAFGNGNLDCFECYLVCFLRMFVSEELYLLCFFYLIV